MQCLSKIKTKKKAWIVNASSLLPAWRASDLTLSTDCGIWPTLQGAVHQAHVSTSLKPVAPRGKIGKRFMATPERAQFRPCKMVLEYGSPCFYLFPDLSKRRLWNYLSLVAWWMIVTFYYTACNLVKEGNKLLSHMQLIIFTRCTEFFTILMQDCLPINCHLQLSC